MNKKAIDLKVGDKTSAYEVVEDAKEGSDDRGPCIIVRVQWGDGGIDYRAFDLDAMVEVL